MTGLFIDFYDSFSENIIDEFVNQAIKIESIKWDDKYLYSKITDNKYYFIVLGPGPGHVDDYKNISSLISTAFKLETKVIGFCLGHQLLAAYFGYNIIQLDKPLHAKSYTIQLTEDFFNKYTSENVQFYNSWYVEHSSSHQTKSLVSIINNKSMVCALRGINHLSYQFHPESVGTTCPSAFFSFIKDFLYNSENGN